MGLTQLLFTNPVLFIILAVILIYSVIFHEVAHGWVAHRFGDDTALRYGRLTLNPASHFEPFGTLMLFFVGFGWAKPVPVNYYGLKNMRFALFSVALAGCLTNILIAIIAMFLLQLEFITKIPTLAIILPIVIRTNIMLGAFNLIPLPPLDGSKVLMSFLPQDTQEMFSRIEPYGFFILIFLLFTGLLNPLINFMYNMIFGFIGLLFSFLPG